ncbi:MAG: hypothetical protein ABJE80_05985 [Reichenbachiella sp.]|uniref:hypothetical protein n=3 Tax=Reichenbachiella sp. TaxID=2184521 RepID=UPI003263B2D8
MLNKWLFIFLVFAGMIMVSSRTSYAQLLEDRNKLKTARRATGFLQFKKKAKIKGPSGKHKTIAAGTPKYSKPPSREGSSRNVNPKFSVITAGQVKGRKINPRYTKHNAGEGADRNVNPRYTKTNAGEVGGRNINPRYSQWKQAGKVVVVNPRFSTPPSYSRTKPPGNRKKGFLPTLNLYRKPPKYKPGPNSEYAGAMKRKVQRPFHVGDHNQNIKSYKKFTSRPLFFSPNAKMANYEIKTKKMRKGRDMYPSANYLSAKYYKSRTIRDVKRKFNVVWVRMHGNKIQPNAVKKKSKKAKFDKDEIEIWNN